MMTHSYKVNNHLLYSHSQTSCSTYVVVMMKYFVVSLALFAVISNVVCDANVAPIKPGPNLNGTSLKELIQEGSARSLVISIVNHLNDTSLEQGKSFIQRGHAKLSPPETIEPRTEAAMTFDGAWLTSPAVSGIVAYDIKQSFLLNPVRFAILFTVPLLASNRFGIAILDKSDTVNRKLYDDLIGYEESNNSTAERQFGYASKHDNITASSGNYDISAMMTNDGRALLKVHVRNRLQDDSLWNVAQSVVDKIKLFGF